MKNLEVSDKKPNVDTFDMETNTAQFESAH